jgi:hypothetical protein
VAREKVSWRLEGRLRRASRREKEGEAQLVIYSSSRIHVPPEVAKG